MRLTYILAILAAGASVACTEDSTVPEKDYRELVVNTDLGTKTTISYENSDVSHLIWKSGDKIAYITSKNGDIVRTAEVKSNTFTAQLPSDATSSDTFTAFWPVSGNEGKTLSQISVEIPSEVTMEGGSEFDGSLLPMYSSFSVPSSNEINAEFTMLGSVVRVKIDPTDHESEILKSVTLSANEYLSGVYSFDPSAENGWKFTGTSKSVKINITGEGEKVILSNKDLYVYIPVNRASYTGVSLTVETDAGKYEKTGGSMNLNEKGRTLYRIEGFQLTNPVVVENPYFLPVSGNDELTDDGTYLITTAESPYYMPAGKITGGSGSYDVLDVTPVAVSAKGIEKTDEIMKYTFKLTDKGSNTYRVFSEYNQKYVVSRSTCGSGMYAIYYVYLLDGSKEDSVSARIWDLPISIEDGIAKFKFPGTGTGSESMYLKFCTKGNDKYFCYFNPMAQNEVSSVTARELKIYKLSE